MPASTTQNLPCKDKTLKFWTDIWDNSKTKQKKIKMQNGSVKTDDLVITSDMIFFKSQKKLRIGMDYSFGKKKAVGKGWISI